MKKSTWIKRKISKYEKELEYYKTLEQTVITKAHIKANEILIEAYRKALDEN